MSKRSQLPRVRLHLQTGNELPPDYKLYRTYSLSRSWVRLFIVNVLGALVCIGVGFFYLFGNLITRGDLRYTLMDFIQLPVILVVGGNLLSIALFHALHEYIHAALLYFYTRVRPHLGFKLYYLTVTLPNWYLPRGNFMLVTLAPLLVLTILGTLLFRYIPLWANLALIFALGMNAASSVGDIFIAWWAMRLPSKVLFEYLGDSVNAYYLVKKSKE